MASYESSHEYQVALQPPALQRKWGERWGTCVGVLKTALCELTDTAVKTSIIDDAPDDALVWIGAEREIERGPGESLESYRARLKNAWIDWKNAGADGGVVGALAAAGYKAAVRRDRQWKHDDLEPGDVWARMWVILTDVPASWTIVEDYTALAAKYPTWADWAAAKVGWGVEAPLSEIEHIRRLVHKWTSSHVLIVNVIVIARGRVFGFPDVASYSDLPADTYDSFVAYWEGI